MNINDYPVLKQEKAIKFIKLDENSYQSFISLYDPVTGNKNDDVIDVLTVSQLMDELKKVEAQMEILETSKRNIVQLTQDLAKVQKVEPSSVSDDDGE